MTPAVLDALTTAGDPASASQRFWRSVTSTPLIGPARDDARGTRVCDVTFLWRQPRSDVEVMLHLNGVTDAMRDDLTPALLAQVPGTDVWHLTWTLPIDGTWGYRLVELPHIDRDAGATRQGWLAMHAAGRQDPLNHRWQPHRLGTASSVLVMPEAYQHPAWSAHPYRLETLAHLDLELDGQRWSAHHWSPVEAPAATLLLFDGERWAALGLADALAQTSLDVEVLAIDSMGPQRRSRDLPDPDRACALAEAALAALTHHTGRRPGPGRVLVAGQSFGGLAAASVALIRPDLARTAIVQSGSFWYRAAAAGRGRCEGRGDLLRGVQQRTIGDAGASRLILQAGTDERDMATLATRMHAAARAAGIRSSLAVISGAHDDAWWKHHLLAEVERLVLTTAASGTPAGSSHEEEPTG